MKTKIKKSLFVTSPSIKREEARHFYLNKYYNLFMNSVIWEGINYQARDFIMKKFWTDGKIACFKLDKTDELVFTPFAPTGFNIYDWPTHVSLINIRGATFIPRTQQKVDEEVTLGYCQRNKKSVCSLVMYYIDKIVDVEMVISINLKVQKTPWVGAVTPENRAKIEEFIESLENDEFNMFIDIDDINNLKALTSGAQYVIDKLYQYKCALENELKEYLGINNMGMTEKKEHLINSEVESNNEVVQASGECFIDMMKEFCENTNKLFNSNISVRANIPDEIEDESEDEENDNE